LDSVFSQYGKDEQLHSIAYNIDLTNYGQFKV
jgi:hypothetical protein